MTFRSLGLVPAIALLAVGVAHAQSNPVTPGRGPSDVGNMAYPTPLPQGNVTTTSPTAPRDTGNMAYPTPLPQGNVATTTAAPRDTGNMGIPAGTGGPATVPFRRRPRPAATAMAAPATPVKAPTADGMAAAKALDTAPGTAAVPYTDFAQPAAMKGKPMMHAKKPMMKHKAAAKKPAAAAPAAAAPAAPAPAK